MDPSCKTVAESPGIRRRENRSRGAIGSGVTGRHASWDPPRERDCGEREEGWREREKLASHTTSTHTSLPIWYSTIYPILATYVTLQYGLKIPISGSKQYFQYRYLRLSHMHVNQKFPLLNNTTLYTICDSAPMARPLVSHPFRVYSQPPSHYRATDKPPT